MKKVSKKEAEQNFAHFINLASKGEDIVITHDGLPMVKIVAINKKERVGGQLKDVLKVSDDFDDPLPDDLLKKFYGEEDDDQ